MEIFRSMLQGFLLFSPVSLTELCSFWYGLKDLFTLHKLVDKVVLDNKADDVTSGRKDVDPDGHTSGCGRLSREQVKNAVLAIGLGLGLGLGLTLTLTLNCMYVFFFRL